MTHKKTTSENPATPAPYPRFQVLGVRLTSTSPALAVGTILDWVATRQRRSVCVFAADSVLKSYDNPELRQIANDADMLLTDGMPLVWLGRHAAGLKPERCYGPDIMLQTLAAGRATGVRHYFYGGSDDEVLALLERRLREQFPDLRVAGRYSPPHRPLTDSEKTAVVEDINSRNADIVWVGIGTPKQDFWVGEFRPLLDSPVLVAVGAAFNFHAGTVRQAPRWMMRCGLEWLFRLAAEPRRLWRRYLIGNPRFVFLLIRQWITRKPAPVGKVFVQPQIGGNIE